MEHMEQTIRTHDEILWHVETFKPPAANAQREVIVLIPSGEGDCHSLSNLARILCQEYGYDIVTFDNPGFSRTLAPPHTYEHVTPQLMAEQIDRLLEELHIENAAFFGCSSGGLAVLSLIAHHSERVKYGIIHEVPFECPPPLVALKSLGDTEIAETCKNFFATQFTEDRKRWGDLGEEYHSRLAKNYVTWVRHVVNLCEDAGRQIATPENLTKRPISWTVGGLNEGIEDEQGFWKLDFEIARQAGLEVDTRTLKCLHFPAVSMPETTAKWIDDCVRGVEGRMD